MQVQIRGASEHNLKDVDVEIGDGLTVVTGVSGSGKTSLVFDVLYHEARRRFLDVFAASGGGLRLAPAKVESVTGLGPAIAVGQNLLNRNPGSTLATASGLHPFLRLLYARFGERRCWRCGAALSVLAEDEIVERVMRLSEAQDVGVYAVLMRGVRGSHSTLLRALSAMMGGRALWVDGVPWEGQALEPTARHDLDVLVATCGPSSSVVNVRQALGSAWRLGATAVDVRAGSTTETLSVAPMCIACGAWFNDLEPVHFHSPCPYCGGEGCPRCAGTGLHPEAAAVRWQNLRLPDLLALSVDQAHVLFEGSALPTSGSRLLSEIRRRLDALLRVGLGYVSLNRPSPSLSRGESQRVRLAVALTSRLEDMLHVLDEPTIGQHPADVARLLPAFRDLLGPVVYVEHDRLAAAAADRAIDLGPGAGEAGGRVVFRGTPAELWHAETATGRYFSLRERVALPPSRPPPDAFLTVRGAYLRNLRDVDVSIPLGRLTVISGVSGSGKSTFVEDVLAASLAEGCPVGCRRVEGAPVKAVMIDQSPIGRNPRSNPATYTKLSDVIRDLYASSTGLSPSHFSFNRPEGACPTCKGLGAVEVQMRYMPSTWIPCADCEGQRFNEQVLAVEVRVGDEALSIADLYALSIAEIAERLRGDRRLPRQARRTARRILGALCDIGLGYLELGQPSPTLSGGEAQRVKLARYLGRRSLSHNLLIMDEPSTGLHPQDIAGLLKVLDRLVRSGATVVVVEHNTDIIRAADWLVDLGPGAGPAGGRVLYCGPPAGLLSCTDSITGRALRQEERVVPARDGGARGASGARGSAIEVRGARANNLRNVDLDLPKGALTVVTGVSGSGKSSLVGDVLEAEARRRYLESLSLYERQGTSEGPEAPVDAIRGLGVVVTVTPSRRMRIRRATVGSVTEIAHHLAVLLSWAGTRRCVQCGSEMVRDRLRWRCPSCGESSPIARPRHFDPSTYAAACLTCNGVGTLRKPNPDKLIVHPEKPLCGGAMHSPGFFPKGYLCKPYNGGYYVVQAFARRHGFDPATTPWNQLSPEAQHGFLYGEEEPLQVIAESRTGRTRTYVERFRGFYGWIGDWDAGGTYTDTQVCPDCGGGKLRAEYAAVHLGGHNLHALSEMPLDGLADVLAGVRAGVPEIAMSSLDTALRRLRFLRQVGLGYVQLNRPASSLSAGEAQRIALAGLLGSGLTSLTVLLDEPTRGLHPREVGALVEALAELRDEGNTVVVVEHDLELIRAADHIVDMGPGAGALGGRIVAQGRPGDVAQSDTVTAAWLRGERSTDAFDRRPAQGWMTVRGARANNLRRIEVRFPLGCLTGLCGVSGSGKSTLLIDTLGRALAPAKQTTSVAYEEIEPGEHDAIEGAPRRVVLVDQSRRGLRSPVSYLALSGPIHRLYAQSEDALALGLSEKVLSRGCQVCGGSGTIRIDMGFLPDVYLPCEVCRGTGYCPEAWDVRLRGVSLPELLGMTIDEVCARFPDEDGLTRLLSVAGEVGLGYLVLRQPGYALSGGEAQRLKIAKELSRRGRATSGSTLYILDEPTVGQHPEDVKRLVGVLHRLVEGGHTVLVVEHHPHVLAACDWLIELGPGGGPEGGLVIAQGPPEEVAQGDTPTAPYLRRVLVGAS
ncbi:MAG: ATP-binding cassette domain-containing protein [Anaerolineae bacterium]|nr:ATP-binding cassette domain-containing protein [Anaerolineae bacterium]